MNDWAISVVTALVRSTLIMSVSAVLVLTFLRLFRVTSPRLRRLACVAIILQGWLLVQVPVLVPASFGRFISGEMFVRQGSTPRLESYGLELVEKKSGTARGFDFELVPNPVAESPSQKLAIEGENIAAEVVSLEQSNGSPIPWAAFLMSAWCLGIAVILCRAIWSYGVFIWRLPSSSPNSPEWSAEWEDLQRQGGVRHLIPLQVVPQRGPMLCWHPRGFRLIVPTDLWNSLTSAQRRPILQHELAHLIRRDIAKSLIEQLLALPYWFNPLVWKSVKHFDDCAEWACDEAVRNAGDECVTEYARTLLQLCESSTSPRLATSAISGGNGLALRIRRLLVTQPRKDSIMKKLVMVTLVLGLAAFQMIRFQLRAEDKSPANAEKKQQVTEISGGATVVIQNEDDSSAIELTADRFVLFTNVAEPAKAPAEAPADDATGVIVPRNVAVEGANWVPEAAKRTEAVVDMRYLFKHAKPFEQERENLKAVIGENEQRMKRMHEDLQSLKEKYKSADKSSAGDAEVILAQRVILKEKAKQIEAESVSARSMILGKETEIQLAMYEKVVAEVTAYAKEQGIRIVRRKNSAGYGIVGGYAAVYKTEDVTVTAKNGSTVNVPKKVVQIVKQDDRASKEEQPATPSQLLQKIMEKEIIYSETDQENDITEEILKRLNAKFEAEKAGEPEKR